MKKIINITVFLLTSMVCFSQTEKFNSIPKETIIANTNTNFLITGETLFYKLNCLNKETNHLSNISKIAYVLLINNAKEVVLKHKLKLLKGTCYGDYYIPTDLKTGNYKFIAYTKWMLNNKVPFFSKNIYIINPYTKKDNENSKFITNENSCKISLKNNLDSITKYKTYKTRSKVSLDFNDLQKGNYTVSVRKIEPIKLLEGKREQKMATKNHFFYLPEIRGEIISGTVTSLKDNTPITNKIVYLSIVGNKTLLKNSKTNKLGKFYFNLDENYHTGKLILQILDKENKNFKINLDDTSFYNFNNLEFSNLVLDANLKNWLIEKNINTQIESSYFNVKENHIIKKKLPKIFYGKSSFTYDLDDYKRFGTMKETFVEVIEGALIKKHKGVKKIILLSPNSKLDKIFTNLNLLILIDGIPIQKHETLIDYDPYKVKKMSFIKEPYFYGAEVYSGIIDVVTIKGDFSPTATTPVLRKEILNLQNQKKYYNPNYEIHKAELERIPDYRTQLLWNPNYNAQEKITFFTSDNKGMFEILVEGYSSNGNLIKTKQYILVQ